MVIRRVRRRPGGRFLIRVFFTLDGFGISNPIWKGNSISFHLKGSNHREEKAG